MAAVEEAADKSEPESETEEDVYEVERIVDMKISEGQVLYRVHWKGYSSEDDTWEPEAHLEDCTEVLQVFKRKLAEKSPAKENRKLTLDKDIFEDESTDDYGGMKETFPQKTKKKKKSKTELDMKHDSPKIDKKAKSSRSTNEELRDNALENVRVISEDGKVKQRSSTESKKLKKKHDAQRSLLEPVTQVDLLTESLSPSENKEQKIVDPNDPTFEKTTRGLIRQDVIATSKRALDSSDEDDLELKIKKKKKKRDKVDNSKQEIKFQKQRRNHKDDYSEKKTVSKENSSHGKKHKCQEKQKESVSSVKSDGNEVKVSKFQMEAKGRKSSDDENSTTPKQDCVKIAMMKLNKMCNVTDSSPHCGTEKVTQGFEPSVTTSGQPSQFAEPSLFDKLGLDSEINRENMKTDKSNYSAATTEEKLEAIKVPSQSVSRERLGKKAEAPKEMSDKKLDIDKGRKEQSVDHHNREMKGLFDKFLIPFTDSTDDDDRENKDSISQGSKFDGNRTKGKKQVAKDKKSAKEESDCRVQSGIEETQEVLDTMSQTEENPDGKQEMLKLGVDLQLDWMTLEDFQKHLDGNDALISAPKTISNSVLRDAVKSGNYLTVKLALNSSEEYNLDQEDPSGMNLVMFAAAGGQDDILRLLIKKGANISSRQKNGTTALMHAAEKNYLTTVAILLEAGSQVNVQQISGETALMKACKRGNADIVRLLLEYGADCGILSKHQNNALYYAKQSNNVLVYDLLKNHVETISRVTDETIRDYFEARLSLLEPVFPVACHRLCEGPDFALDFNYKPQHNSVEGTGILLFIFHANFYSHDHIVAKLCGSCSVQAVILNDKFQLPVFLDSHFIYSFSPVPGANKLFIRLAEAPTAKVKLLICAYRVQLQ
ncbi:M-phase phosphoprotein 8 isoform X1 [Chiloscyllium plagiosum]|uniref:M-phase phosphoprotein 8 isoform X1 n=2 Tax=Chiloscyllium plagiosum TaxID=36176 RepID=UPI001CB84331|nr:M-phase phosphoprotein 8 isoform X1 [Chiloscyllium plagiosum]